MGKFRERLSDPPIRREVKREIRYCDPTVAFIDELHLSRGEGRADLAAINGCLSGFEIKSELDTLARLDFQIPQYERVFEFCHVVVVERHLIAVAAMLPPHWGIQLVRRVDSSLEITEVRRAQRNSAISSAALIRLLWKPDIVRLLRSRGKAVTAHWAIRDLWEVLEPVPREELLAAARESLKLRAAPRPGSRRRPSGD